jgi:acyl-CoA reductase-like NAD-dependent aldehyde dehydrogenase
VSGSDLKLPIAGLQRAAASLRENLARTIVNDAPTIRADHMPYGGNRQSGLGREGLRFAMEDMTSIQMVAIKRSS